MKRIFEQDSFKKKTSKIDFKRRLEEKARKDLEEAYFIYISSRLRKEFSGLSDQKKESKLLHMIQV